MGSHRRVYHFWAFLHRAPSLVIIASVLCVNINAIRVYEGTTHEHMLGVKLGKSLNSSVISKRSWSPSNIDIEPTDRISRRIDDDWREVDRKSTTSIRDKDGKIIQFSRDMKVTPNLYKVKLTQKGYIQFLRYLADVPNLQEYTFCLWFTSSNLTHSHPLFSYSMHEKERVIGFWYHPPDSTLRMGIRNEIIFKIPVHIRVNRWYHVCQSWSGLTGEWMVFLDGKKKGSGRLLQYQGTYVPGGGDIAVGQELTDADKGLDDGVEGEIFGFNLVDEAVDVKDQAIFMNPSNRVPELLSQQSVQQPVQQPAQQKIVPPVIPGTLPPVVPPFKAMPPMKKTFHDIKAYLSKLPVEPKEERPSPTLTEIAAEPNIIKTDDVLHPSPTRFVRQKSKTRYKPPMRKVVVYREDRQLGFESRKLDHTTELFKKTGELAPSLPEIVTETPDNNIEEQTEKKFKINQIYDENYSIHSYRLPKQKIHSTNYEIYEIPVEEVQKPLEQISKHKYDKIENNQRKARQNFDVYTARQVNKLYPFASRVQLGKPRYHFELRGKLAENRISRRSFETDDESSGVTKRSTDKFSALPDFIPVYEIIEDDTPRRKKRDADNNREFKHIKTVVGSTATGYNEFRRLPKIPESFINLFAGNTPKTEIEEKLKEFFPERKNETQIPRIAVQSSNHRTPVQDKNNITIHILNSAKATISEEKEYMKEAYMKDVLKQRTPQNFPNLQDLERLQEPEKEIVQPSPSYHSYVDENRRRYVVPPKVADANVEKGKFHVSSGTELVMRSYGQCGVDRGTPISNKKHVIVSWSETPVRIFGGAMVANAKNICGHF